MNYYIIIIKSAFVIITYGVWLWILLGNDWKSAISNTVQVAEMVFLWRLLFNGVKLLMKCTAVKFI